MWEPPFGEKNGPWSLASGLPPLQKAREWLHEGWDCEAQLFRHATYRLVSKRVLSDVNKQIRSLDDLVEAI